MGGLCCWVKFACADQEACTELPDSSCRHKGIYIDYHLTTWHWVCNHIYRIDEHVLLRVLS
jgi:hypothetical protein